MMEEIQVFLICILLIPLGILLYLSPWWLRWLWPKVRYCLAEKTTVRAKVLELQAKSPLYLRDGGWFRTWDEEVFYTHYAVFKTEDNKQYSMRISKEQYQEMMQGSTGILTHKGNCFVSFEPEK